MEIIIRNSDRADKFAAIFQYIKLFTDHIAIICSETHMKMQCMDNAHVTILEMSLPASWFDVYNLDIVNSGETIRIGFNATYLHRILSSRDKDQKIHLSFSLEESENLLINLTKSDNVSSAGVESDVLSKKTKDNKPLTNTFDKHFELPLIDIEEEIMKIPDIEYTAELSMHSAQFADIITQLKMFGDTMEVQCSEERITLASTSQDQGKMFVEIGINDLSEFAIDEGANLALSFSLTYLKHFCAYSRISELVSIKIGESYPMRIAYSLGEQEDANLVFHLAPKIND
jgi:proliferating cell nuclear antigen